MTENRPRGPRPERIAVEVDGSVTSRAALCWATDHAREGDTVTLVHVWQASPALIDAGLGDPGDDTAALSFARHELARAQTLLHSTDVRLESEVLHGDPRDCLRQLDTDLLAVGARGQARVAGLRLGELLPGPARHPPESRG